MKCEALLITRKENPLVMNLRDACAYHAAGCKLLYRPEDMAEHLQECKFRQYRCVGATLGAWLYVLFYPHII